MGWTAQNKYIDAFAEDILELLALSGGEAEMEWVLRQVCRKHHVLAAAQHLLRDYNASFAMEQSKARISGHYPPRKEI